MSYVGEYNEPRHLDEGRSWSSVGKIGPRGSLQHVAISYNAIHVVYSGDYDNIMYIRGELPQDTLPILVNKRWNLVSVPAYLSMALKDSVFPTAISGAFTYENGHYVQTETLKTGVGYWLKFTRAETVSVTGIPIRVMEIPVKAGWNMIGGINTPLPVSAVETEPVGIISSSFFGYKSGYIMTDTLFPGKSYWVKSKTDGILILQE